MKYYFWPDKSDSPSAVFYIQMLRNICNILLISDLDGINSDEKSMLLVHGRDSHRSDQIKAFMGIKILVEPRVFYFCNYDLYDRCIFNSIEAELSTRGFRSRTLDFIIFPPFPIIERSRKPNLRFKDVNGLRLTLGYHGNSVHWELFRPKLNKIIRLLFLSFEEVSIIAVSGSRLVPPVFVGGRGHFEQLSFSKDNLGCLGVCDVGLVPQFEGEGWFEGLKVADRWWLRFRGLLRIDVNWFKFKAASNLGRHVVFSSVGVPCVSDPTISAVFAENFFGRVATGYRDWARQITDLRLCKFEPSLHEYYELPKLKRFLGV